MPPKPAEPEKTSARERLLTAAQTLFYEEGINSVGIDRVIEHAGVAKASLYNTFGSKDELIHAYLLSRHDARHTRISEKLALHTSPREKILAVFDDQREMAASPGFHGCAFVRASAELGSEPGVRDVCTAARAWLLGLFTELATLTGARAPALLGRQLTLLYDGVAVSGQMDHAAGASQAARVAAIQLLEASGVKSQDYGVISGTRATPMR